MHIITKLGVGAACSRSARSLRIGLEIDSATTRSQRRRRHTSGPRPPDDHGEVGDRTDDNGQVGICPGDDHRQVGDRPTTTVKSSTATTTAGAAARRLPPSIWPR